MKHSLGRRRTVQVETIIQKIKIRMKRQRPPSARKVAIELHISRTRVHRLLKEDLKVQTYNELVEQFLTNQYKEKTKLFVN